MDQAGIEHGQNWPERLENALDEATFLIPIITPSYFTSKYCRDELQRFLERERSLGRNDLILPIYYRQAPQLDNEAMQEDDSIAEAIRVHQYVDWRELRYQPFTDPKVRRALADIGRLLRGTLERQGFHTPVEAETHVVGRSTAYIVRISREDQTPVGTGFLVSDRHVLTCAHVVAEALHISGDTAERPQGEVQLDFQTQSATDAARTARVERWQPPKGSGANLGDVAVLRLATAPPEGVRPARLAVESELYGHEVRAFGYPVDNNAGVWAYGRLRDQIGDGRFQVEGVEGQGRAIEPSFSGSPVQDQEMESIVGMVSASAEDNVSYVIPSDILASILPETIEVAARAIADGWSRDDLLGFSDYAKALADLIRDPSTDLPLTIGIDAPWGMGKTTLMHMIESQLQPEESDSESLPEEPEAEPFPTVWFNACV